MSGRKKNTRSSTKKQAELSSYFSTKKSSVPPQTKRVVQSSLVARPLRSRKTPDDDEVLDLTRSTSPPQEDQEPPPTKKKRKTRASTAADHVTRSSAHHSLFDNDMSPLTTTSSPAPSPRSQPATPNLHHGVETMAISSTPSPTRTRSRDTMIIDDPNDIVESSQTQYIHLRFTPTRSVVESAPVSTPPSRRPSTVNRATSSKHIAPDDSMTPTGPSDWRIPSSQGEMSEPRTPRKRSWATFNRSGTPSKASVLSDSTIVISSSVASGSQGERDRMPPPILPASAMMSSADSHPGVAEANLPVRSLPLARVRSRPIAFGMSPSRLANLRAQSKSIHPSSDDRPDHVPSSQGEPSLEPTELGTIESPQRPAAYPSIDTDLLTTIPSSNPASQEPPARASIVRPHTTRPDMAQPPRPQTPAMSSSQSDLPSPRAFLGSLGIDAGTQERAGPSPRGTQKGAIVSRPGPNPVQASPERAESVIPSSQPLHDSSPPPDYDIDPEVHSYNQARIQRPHSSQEGSSQPLPASQSLLRTDPDKSGAGMKGVFGMLGFGSEAESGTYTPLPPSRTLPPSSPPPETPLPKTQSARSQPKPTTPVRARKGPPSSLIRIQNQDSQTQSETVAETPRRKSKAHARSQSVGVQSSIRPKRTLRPNKRTPLAAREIEYVGSSDAEEQAMEIEPILDIATSPVRERVKGKENVRTPVQERLPSSVSPSPRRYSSPSPLEVVENEDTQTIDETETPWETLRPSQSVSQVLERRIIEEALRGAAARAEKEKARLEQARLEQETRREKEEEERRKAEMEEGERREQMKNAEAPGKASGLPPPQVVTRPTAFSTPKARRVRDEIHIVTPTKVVKRTPVKKHRDRAESVAPSSPIEAGDDDEEYTYIDETFNPTTSQMSFLNRIMASSEAG